MFLTLGRVDGCAELTSDWNARRVNSHQFPYIILARLMNALIRFTLLILVQVVPNSAASNTAPDIRFSCARNQSRVVRSVLENYLFPLVKEAKYEYPDGCSLNPSLDWTAMYTVQFEFLTVFRHERNKEPSRRGSRWKCGLCGKVFKAESWLDMHFENKHSSNIGKDHVCLADICPLIGCDIYSPLKKRQVRFTAICRLAHLCTGLLIA